MHIFYLERSKNLDFSGEDIIGNIVLMLQVKKNLLIIFI